MSVKRRLLAMSQ